MPELKIPTIDWIMLLPVLIVSCTGILALIVEMFAPKRANNAIAALSVVGLLMAGWSLIYQFDLPTAETFGGMVLRDKPALLFQLLLIAACIVSILFSEGYLREKRISFGEFYPLLIWSTAGGMIMVASQNLLMLFLGLEVLSISLYVMAGMSRQESKSEESALKYFLLGAFASGFLLYGIAFWYGATGGLQLGALAPVWQLKEHAASALILFGLGLVLVGLAFKAALVPFHQWTPDVYQGAPTNVTAFMAAGSKVAAIGALYRVLEAVALLQELWMPALFWIAIATMLVGNLAALVQKDVKRVLGYSSVANAGYLLLALLAHFKAPDRVSLGPVMFYLVAYSAMTIGAFAVVSLSARGGREGTRYADLHGLYARSPFMAVALVIFVASLVGIPPTAGFFGKLAIFAGALDAGLLPLAIVMAVGSIISIYYYWQIAVAAVVNEEGAERVVMAKPGFGVVLASLVCLIGTLGASLLSAPIERWLKPSTQVQVEMQPSLAFSESSENSAR